MIGESRLSASVLAILNSFRWLAAAVLACIFSQHVWAASVTVGNHVLLPDTPNQIVSLYVSGGEQIAGEDFFAQVGDGGTFNGGVNTKPTITYVDMVYGSIFGENNNGPFGDPGNGSLHPLIWVDSTTTISGTVSANGRLAVLVLDTTGLFSGTFPLLLTGVANSYGSFNTTLRDASANLIPLNINNGSLIVATPTPGDFNLDGEVDSADYVAWRNGLGTKYTPADYSDWRELWSSYWCRRWTRRQCVSSGANFAASSADRDAIAAGCWRSQTSLQA